MTSLSLALCYFGLCCQVEFFFLALLYSTYNTLLLRC